MDQTRGFRFLGQVETCRVLLLMTLVVAFVLGLQYFEITPISIGSRGNSTVSGFIEPSDITKSDENEMFLAPQEATSDFRPRNSTTEVLNNSPEAYEHKFLNNSPKAYGQSRGNETANSHHPLQPKIPQSNKKHERSTKKPPLVVMSITQMNNMLLKRHSDPNNSVVCK